MLEQLRASDKYTNAVIFMNVDWDAYKNSPVAKSRNIPRRSTIVLLKGNRELGRIVAGTGKAQIAALLDKALGE